LFSGIEIFPLQGPGGCLNELGSWIN